MNNEIRSSIETRLQLSNGAMMDVTGSIVVEFIGDNSAHGLSLFRVAISPVEHFTGARFSLSYPRYNHCPPLMVSLCYMNLRQITHISSISLFSYKMINCEKNIRNKLSLALKRLYPSSHELSPLPEIHYQYTSS